MHVNKYFLKAQGLRYHHFFIYDLLPLFPFVKTKVASALLILLEMIWIRPFSFCYKHVFLAVLIKTSSSSNPWTTYPVICKSLWPLSGVFAPLYHSTWFLPPGEENMWARTKDRDQSLSTWGMIMDEVLIMVRRESMGEIIFFKLNN